MSLDFISIYSFFNGFLPNGMEWVAFTVAAGALAFLVINVLMLSTAVYTWFERRTLGRFQNRLGPNQVGAVWNPPAHSRPGETDNERGYDAR